VRRETEIPRPDWRRRCEEDGFGFHSMGGAYWDESACYAFDAAQIDRIEAVTTELHAMSLKAADEVVRARRLGEFAIPAPFHGFVEQSWRRSEPSLYGRFDLSWDGRGEPKLLEYNADTPTALLEASVVQWRWLEDKKEERKNPRRLPPSADQFNSIHEKLIERWKAIKASWNREVLHFACVRDSEEDQANVQYLRDCALQAGWDARPLFIDDLGWNGRRFVDLGNEEVEALFKLYPWEWLVREEFGAHVAADPTAWIEPPWKMLLSNKALLVVLWEPYPGHPNLLPAYFEESALGEEFVKKPLLAREGANVTLRMRGADHAAPGSYGAEGYVYQGVAPLPDFGARYPVIGSWIIGDEAAGLGIREDDSPITRNTSRFVPHYFS
jgi:glutathionylspermidine synthase